MRKLIAASLLLGILALARPAAAQPAKAASPPRNGAVAAAADSSGTVKVKLTPFAVRMPELVLSKSDATPAPRVYNGMILPRTAAQFSPENSQVDLTIAGSRLALLSSGNDFGLRSDGGVVRLQRAGLGYRPTAVRVGKDRTYLLAFPYGVPSRTTASLAYRCGFALKGAVGGTTFWIYDDNLDGSFNLADDSIHVGDVTGPLCVLAPMTKYVPTRSGIYQIISLAEDGSEMQFARCAAPAGKIALAFSSAEAEMQVALSSQEAALGFVSAVGPRGVCEVPALPGSYDVLYGAVYDLRLGKVVAAISQGKAAALVVSADKTERLALGGPFTLEFAAVVSGNELTINPDSFHIRGKAGEEYTGVRYAAAPEIALVSGSKVLPLGRMKFR